MPAALTSFLSFAALAGAGWLLDFALFWLGVGPLGLPPGGANLASATIAAMSVYLVSTHLVFRARRAGGKALFIYLVYTEANIIVWAAAIQFLSMVLHNLGGGLTPTLAALLAKIIVTPLSLACNFLVTRFLAQRG